MANQYQDRLFRPDFDERRDGGRGDNSAGEPDPLAELARLIGQTDPFAGFDTQRRQEAQAPHPQQQSFAMEDEQEEAPSPPAWVQRAARQSLATPTVPQTHDRAPRFDDLDHDQRWPEDDPVAAHYRQEYADQKQYADQQHYGAAPSNYDDALYGPLDTEPEQQYRDPYERYDDDAYAEQDEPIERPRRRLVTVAAVVALAVVGTAGAYAYRSYSGGARSGEPPIIKADTTPNKIVPPTSSTDGSGKLIYDRVGNTPPGGERMVSREEQPMNVQDATKSGPRVVFPPLNQVATGAATVGVPAGAQSASAAPAYDEPRRVKTMAIHPDQSDPAPATPAAPRQVATARTTAAPVANANASTGNAPMSLTPQSQDSAADARLRTASLPAQTAASGGYVVQVASQRSASDAQASYRALQGKYPSILGSHSPIIKRADLGSKGVYYRAMIGPFGNQEEASHFCGGLKSAGGQCVVQRN